MEPFLFATTFVYILMAWAWSTKGKSNFVLKATFIAMALWSLITLLHFRG